MQCRVSSFVSSSTPSGPEVPLAALEVQLEDGSWACVASWTGPESEDRAEQASRVLQGLAKPGAGVVFSCRPDGELIARCLGHPRPVVVARFEGAARDLLAATAALRLNAAAGQLELPVARLVEEVASAS